jgi:uncharacterized protein DUF5916/cellulose/xylan binding protein with CBM9 domain
VSPRAWLAAALALASWARPGTILAQAPPAPAAPIEIRRTGGPIEIDGVIADAEWEGAARIDAFVETFPGNAVPPPAVTSARIAYDDRYLYLALRCDDPRPSEIRAPYVDRDAIADSDDSIAVYLDTRGDRRSAMEFRVNPRGQQSDGIFDDASLSEELSPDFFFESASSIDGRGWSAELRIPFSSLRYSADGSPDWGVLIRRNFPRDFRHAIDSAPIPQNASCVICHSAKLSGLAGLPRGSHVVAAPYATLSEKGVPGNGAGAPLQNRPARGRAGIDVKWTPSPGTALDATLHPDFSQVESDAGQISVNRAFALFHPEKRPFFLEGVDLFSTPLAAVYTRTISSPRWGARVTGKSGESSYTFLVAEDGAGGDVVLPGPTASGFAQRPSSSIAAVGRMRQDRGASFAGFLVTDRENAASGGGGHNRVLGPDFQWRIGPHDKLTGQLLVSDTRVPDRPDLFAGWDGRKFASRAYSLHYNHDDTRWHLRVLHQDLGDGFRAEDGFIPQVGIRHEKGVAAYTFYGNGPISRLQAGVFADYFCRSDGALVQRQYGLFFSPAGFRNLGGEIDLVPHQKDLVGNRAVASKFSVQVFGLSIDPGRVFSRISLSGYAGDSPDYANARPGRGADVSLTATVKPSPHLQLDFNGERQWLDVDGPDGRSRLFTAEIARLKATWNFSARSFARVIGEYSDSRRDPRLYSQSVDSKTAHLDASALVAYRLDWQTVAFLGYGDARERLADGGLGIQGRAFFLKISYAFQQ